MGYEFRLTFRDRGEFDRELERNLRRGRTFVPGVEATADRSPCVLFVEHPVTSVVVELRGEIVFVQKDGPGKGAGIELIEPDLSVLLNTLASAVALANAPPAAPPPPVVVPQAEIRVRDLPMGRPSGELLLPLVGVGVEDWEAGEEETEAVQDGEVPSEGPADLVEINLSPRRDSLRMGPRVRAEAAGGDPQRPGADNVHLRVRKLTPAERDRLARTGNLAERTALERAFGGSVWDTLLQNSQITGAEVARIAKNGTAPATVLAHIAGNSAWLARPEVRRGLLQNRRLGVGQIEAVLRATPATELRLVGSQAAYPVRVREVAKRLLRL